VIFALNFGIIARGSFTDHLTSTARFLEVACNDARVEEQTKLP